MKLKKQRVKGVGSDKESPFILIDADIIAYSVASASDGKYYTIEGIEGKFPLIVDVKKAFEKAGLEYDRAIVHEAYDPDPIEHALHSVKLMTEAIVEGAGNGPYQLVLTGKGNFREKIATIQKYKGNRDNTHKPYHLAECRDYLVRRWGAIIVDGEECDDYLGYMQTDKTIIATIDKDLDVIKGNHYRWPHQGKEGYLYFVTKDEANQNFYKQLLTGDTTDNIQGIPGIGGKNPALKVIEGLTDIRAMAEFCFEKYFDYELSLHCDLPLADVKKLAYDKYLENGRLVWIRREEGEIWSPPKK
jgi:hypothetical protein